MKHFIAILVYLYAAFAYGQTTLRGKVVDDHNKPIMGVNVFLQGTIEGASTDENGNFQFVSHQKGSATLVCKHLAMNDASKLITLQDDMPALHITMTEKEAALDEVILTGRESSLGITDKKRAIILNTMDIDTTPGADGDIVSTLSVLPGAQQVGESGLLFVRGGSGEETKVLIDGLEVLNPFYSGVPDVAQRNRFSPHIFKGIIFNTGGYSPQYGNALSSVLSLETNDHPNKPSTVIAILPYGIQGGHDFLSKKETRSGGFDVGYFNFKPYHKLVKQYVEWLKPAESLILTGTFRQNTSKGMLKWYGYCNTMEQAINQPQVELRGEKRPYESKNVNAVSILTYTQELNTDWELYTGYGFNYNRDKITDWNNYEHKYATQHQFRAVAAGTPIDNWHTEVGTELFAYNGNYGNDYTTALWANASLPLQRKLYLQAGIRTEYSNQLHQADVLPRMALNYRTGKLHQLSVSAGLYSQKPTESFLPIYRDLAFAKSAHYIANYQYTYDRRIFRVEAYYKDYQRLLSYANGHLPTASGRGYAKGIDIFWRDSKTLKGFDYWLSYSFLDTQRQFLHYPIMAQPSFAMPHTAHIVAKYFFEQLGLFVGGSYSVSSGRAYENPNNSSFLSDRTPVYYNLNANIALLRKGKHTFNTVVFSVNNITGYEPIFSYRYSNDGSYRLPITLPYKRSFLVGWFISIGKDRSSEIIDQLP